MDRNDAESVIKETIAYANNEIREIRKRSRRIVVATLVSAILITALLGSSFASYATLNTWNPFSAANGYFQITVLDKEYVEIQKSPKVVLAQPNDEILINYMKTRGFTEIPEERMGAMRVFASREEKVLVLVSINAHCAIWRWQ